MEKNQPNNEDLVHFHAEAAASLEVNESKRGPQEPRARSYRRGSRPGVTGAREAHSETIERTSEGERCPEQHPHQPGSVCAVVMAFSLFRRPDLPKET